MPLRFLRFFCDSEDCLGIGQVIWIDHACILLQDVSEIHSVLLRVSPFPIVVVLLLVSILSHLRDEESELVVAV